MTTTRKAPAPRLGSISDAAAIGGVHRTTIRRYISQGLLTGYRMGPRLIRVDLDEVGAVLLRQIPTAGGRDVA